MKRPPPFVPGNGKVWTDQGYDLAAAAERYADFRAETVAMSAAERSKAAVQFYLQEHAKALAQGVSPDDRDLWRIQAWPKHVL